MDLRLDGKVALITGGSRGIGKGIATAMARSGASVMLSSRKPEDLEAAAAEIGHGARWVAANAGDAEQAEAAVDATLDGFGQVDILVNNAATNPYAGPLIDADRGRIDKTLSVNLVAPLVWSQLCWQKSMKERGGSIINISSVGGLATNEVLGLYDLTKAGLLHMTEQLAAELAPGVRVNALCPGLVKTDFSRLLWEDGRGEVVAMSYPLQRLGEVEDVAGAAVYLAAESGRWITGQKIVLDGGGLVSFRN